MKTWLDELQRDLQQLEARALLRRLQPLRNEGPWVTTGHGRLLNCASNDYLALAQHPRLREAAIQAIERFGTGTGASRLAGGHTDWHAELEAAFARFKHAEAALLCPTGYMANHAVLTALAGPGDLICVDKLNHASLLDAASASGAQVRVYPHLQLHKLERLLARHQSAPCQPAVVTSAGHPNGGVASSRRSRRLIVTDSVFSMDGDVADLPALVTLAERYEAILVVDEAHATGVLGADGSGICQAQGVTASVDVVISTASKALGGLGGIVTAVGPVIATLVNRSRSFIYTTAVPPAQAAAIGAAVEVITNEPERRAKLQKLTLAVRNGLREIPNLVLPATTTPTPIVPLMVGSPERALHLAEHLAQAGIFAPAIRPPTVAPGAARVRLSLRCDLPDSIVEHLRGALKRWNPPL